MSKDKKISVNFSIKVPRNLFNLDWKRVKDQFDEGSTAVVAFCTLLGAGFGGMAYWVFAVLVPNGKETAAMSTCGGQFLALGVLLACTVIGLIVAMKKPLRDLATGWLLNAMLFLIAMLLGTFALYVNIVIWLVGMGTLTYLCYTWAKHEWNEYQKKLARQRAAVNYSEHV